MAKNDTGMEPGHGSANFGSGKSGSPGRDGNLKLPVVDSRRDGRGEQGPRVSDAEKAQLVHGRRKSGVGGDLKIERNCTNQFEASLQSNMLVAIELNRAAGSAIFTIGACGCTRAFEFQTNRSAGGNGQGMCSVPRNRPTTAKRIREADKGTSLISQSVMSPFLLSFLLWLLTRQESGGIESPVPKYSPAKLSPPSTG